MTKPKYSWILPIYNEADSLPQLFSEIKTAMASKNYEIIAVNDGSTDASQQILPRLAQKFPRLKIINFASRQGKWEALREAITQARGDIIITLDSDLQDDPKEVNWLLTKQNRGFDLVSGWRRVRFDPFYKVFFSRLGNWLASAITRKRFHDLNSSFKIYRKKVLDHLPQEGSLLRFSPLLAYKLGYKVTEVPIIHRPRLFGKSKFGLVKYLRIVYDLILILLLFTGSGRLERTR